MKLQLTMNRLSTILLSVHIKYYLDLLQPIFSEPNSKKFDGMVTLTLFHLNGSA
jgi:hypothetical protein